ncbi:MAG: hypothetical protein Q9166_003689 [cf. Caloplaca sp. 2 TL-2023]
MVWTKLALLYQVVKWSRYLRLLLDLVQYHGYLCLRNNQGIQRTQIPPQDDFTIISWTLGDQVDYMANIRSWLACDPGAIIIVTIAEKLEKVRTLIETLGDQRIQVYSVKEANARKQAVEGIRRTTTSCLVFVDDDVRWSSHTLHQMALAFSDPVVGGVNTMQQVCPSGSSFTIWESSGALNLVRRNILHSFVAYYTNGHVLNLSGRTTAYRTKLLQREDFYYTFLNDYWRGRHHLRTGDDNFFTSWIVQRGWQTRFMNDKNALIITTVNPDSSYLRQLLRWSRDTARGYLRDLRFAIHSGDASFRFYCLMKILANYTSDMAIAFEVGLLTVVSIWRSVGGNGYSHYPHM